jgi:hypothetical protein
MVAVGPLHDHWNGLILVFMKVYLCRSGSTNSAVGTSHGFHCELAATGNWSCLNLTTHAAAWVATRRGKLSGFRKRKLLGVGLSKLFSL